MSRPELALVKTHTNANGDALIREGVYPVVYVKHSKPWRLHTRWRISVTVRIVGGEYEGVELQAFYSVKNREGSELPDGRSSHLRRDSICVLGEPTAQVERFSGVAMTAEVTTVARFGDTKRTPLPRNQQYSRAKNLRLFKDE